MLDVRINVSGVETGWTHMEERRFGSRDAGGSEGEGKGDDGCSVRSFEKVGELMEVSPRTKDTCGAMVSTTLSAKI